MRLVRHAAVALAALSAFTSAHAAEGDIWRLQKIVVVNELDPNIRPETLWADSVGGLVYAHIDGALLEKCPGGYETLHVTWSMDDVRELAEGSVFPIRVSASGNAIDPCAGTIAAQSFISPAGSKGITWALPPDEMEQVDQDRFTDAGPGETRAYPAGKDAYDGVGHLTRDMTLAAYDPVPGRPLAYFEIRMVVFGSSGELRIVYVFSKGAPPVVPPTAGEPPAAPG